MVLDEIDSHLFRYRAAAAATDLDALTAALTEILSVGRELRVHVVMTSQTSMRLPTEWVSLFSSVVLAGEPNRATTLELTGFERIPEARWAPRGQMLLIKDSFSYKPFQAYISRSSLDVVPGQHPRLALDTTGFDLENAAIEYTELADMGVVLLDRQVKGRWEPDPERVHLDPWEPFRS